jgi:hypothetical protein
MSTKMEMHNVGKFCISSAWSIYTTPYPTSMDSPYAGGEGYIFCFNDGRVFEIVVNHYPRRITIKRWCNVTLDEFLATMKNTYDSL